MSPIDPRELKQQNYVEVIDTDRRCGKCGYNLRGLKSNGKCPECSETIQPRKPVRTYTDVIETDRLCGKCRYNLRGLPTDGRCPECGHPIRGGGRAGFRRFSDNLTQAPLFYLKTLAIGAWIVALSGVAMAVSLHMARGMQRLDGAVAAGCFAVLWWVGVFIVTAPRAFGENTLRDEALDGPHLRWINRGVNTVWLAVAAAWVVAFRALYGSRAEEIAIVAANVLSLIGIGGLVTLGLQLAALADWAGDSHLAERFRTTAWILGAAVLLALVATVGSQFQGLMTGFLVWLARVMGIIGGLALLYFAWSLIQLAGLATWAIHNHVTADVTERRMLTERQRREKQMADRTAVAIALQDAAPPPTLAPDAKAQTAFENNRLSRQRDGADPYEIEPER